MSQHHRAQKSDQRTARSCARRSPPCCPCRASSAVAPVTRDMTWHVGHRQAAVQGGRPTMANCGPAHASCNLKAGGKLGAAITNRKRPSAKDTRPW